MGISSAGFVVYGQNYNLNVNKKTNTKFDC